MSECEKTCKNCDNYGTLPDCCELPDLPCGAYTLKQPRRDCTGCVHVIDADEKHDIVCKFPGGKIQFSSIEKYEECTDYTPTPSGHWIAGDVPMTIYGAAKAGIDPDDVYEFVDYMRGLNYNYWRDPSYNYMCAKAKGSTLIYILPQPECWAAALQDAGMLVWVEDEVVTYKRGDKFSSGGIDWFLTNFILGGKKYALLLNLDGNGNRLEDPKEVKDWNKITPEEISTLTRRNNWELIK